MEVLEFQEFLLEFQEFLEFPGVPRSSKSSLELRENIAIIKIPKKLTAVL